MTLPIVKQVASLELSKRLCELKVPQKSVFRWYNFKNFVPKMGGTWSLVIENDEEWKGTYEDRCSAFTVAELGEMLDMDCTSYPIFRDKSLWACVLGKDEEEVFKADTEADCR